MTIHKAQDETRVTMCYKNVMLEICINCSCLDPITNTYICCDSPGMKVETVHLTNTTETENFPSEGVNDWKCVRNTFALLTFILLFFILLYVVSCRVLGVGRTQSQMNIQAQSSTSPQEKVSEEEQPSVKVYIETEMDFISPPIFETLGSKVNSSSQFSRNPTPVL